MVVAAARSLSGHTATRRRAHWRTCSCELAQVDVARLAVPLTDPLLADFVAALDPVNAVADSAPPAHHPRRARQPPRVSRRAPRTRSEQRHRSDSRRRRPCRVQPDQRRDRARRGDRHRRQRPTPSSANPARSRPRPGHRSAHRRRARSRTHRRLAADQGLRQPKLRLTVSTTSPAAAPVAGARCGPPGVHQQGADLPQQEPRPRPECALGRERPARDVRGTPPERPRGAMRRRTLVAGT